MSTGRTTDDRDRDSRRHKEIMGALERIESRLGIVEQQLRAQQDPRTYNEPRDYFIGGRE